MSFFKDLRFGFTEDMNRRCRRSMEDSHCFQLDLTHEGSGFFGIFDGHAGKSAAEWCGENIIDRFKLSLPLDDDVQHALCKLFMDTDVELCDKKGIHSGCTAVVAFIQTITAAASEKRILYCANVGDARIVLCRRKVAVRLSYDHKGQDPIEIRRILDSGGFIMNNRVNGVLAVTRSLGDVSMKDLVLSAPYTCSVEMSRDDEFIVLACDGVWDVLSDQEVVDLVYGIRDPQEASDLLVKTALERHSQDNISCMVVRFCDDRSSR